jgi:Mrp family chromosome partitioning ATPase
MKHPPQPMPKAPHIAVETAPAAKSLTVELSTIKPMTARFEPWPAPAPTPLGISSEIVAYHQPDHPASKAYASLLEAMRAALRTDESSVLLLTGLKPHVGVSTVLLNLAVCAARAQKLRIVVVDANLHQPDLAKRLGHAGTAGLMEVIEGTLALEHAVVSTGVDALHVLSAGMPVKMHHPLSTEAMAWLIAWLRERFDLILIDGSTIDDTASLAVQVPHADAVYLVAPHGETVNKGIAQTIGRLGGRLCGLIHTHLEI